MSVNQKVVDAIRQALGRPMPNPVTNGEFIYRSILQFFVGAGPYKIEKEQIVEHTYLSEDEIDRLLERLVNEEILVKTERASIFDDPDDSPIFYKLNVKTDEEKEISNDDDNRREAEAKQHAENMKKELKNYVDSKRPKQYFPPPPDEDSDGDGEEDGPSSQPFTRNSVSRL